MSGKLWRLKRTDGTILHEGRSKSRKDLIQSLARSTPPVSLSGIDLSGADLSGLDLRGVDLSLSNLEGATFRGTNLKDANLSGANLRRSSFHGVRMDRARFDAAILVEADLSGARATCASFQSADLTKADCCKMSASSAMFNHGNMDGTEFRDAELYNADFRDAKVIEVDFRGAKLAHRVFGGKSSPYSAEMAPHLANRTSGAVVVGCQYGRSKAPGDNETMLCDTVPGLKTDRRVGKAANFLLWASSTLSAVLAVEHGADAISEYFEHLGHFGRGFGLVAVIGGLYLVKEKVVDIVKDKLQDGLHKILRKVREGMRNMEQNGIHRMHLVCMIAERGNLSPIEMALKARNPEAEEKGFWAKVNAFATDLGHVVLCDRRHLALALGTLSRRRHFNIKADKDIVLMRCDGSHGQDCDGPCVLSFLSNGTTTATWASGNKTHATTTYDADGNLTGCWKEDGTKSTPEALGLPAAAAARLDVMLEFESALLKDHGLTDFSYDRETHFIEDGRDGSIIVRRLADNRVDNGLEHGSVGLVKMDDSAVMVRNGAVIEHEETDEGLDADSYPAAAFMTP